MKCSSKSQMFMSLTSLLVLPSKIQMALAEVFKWTYICTHVPIHTHTYLCINSCLHTYVLASTEIYLFTYYIYIFIKYPVMYLCTYLPTYICTL